MIGPRAIRPTRPKLSFSEALSPRAEATPNPKAMMKGTVSGPVMTHPKSKEAGRNSAGATAPNANTIP